MRSSENGVLILLMTVVYDQVKTRLLKLQAEAEELNQSQSMGISIVIGLFSRFCFWLQQSSFH